MIATFLIVRQLQCIEKWIVLLKMNADFFSKSVRIESVRVVSFTTFKFH